MRYTITRVLLLLALVPLLSSTTLSQQPELQINFKELDRLRAFALSADGQVFATVSQDNAIRLWELSSGKNIATLEGQRAGISTIAFSGTRLASGSSDGTVRVWDVKSGLVVIETQGHVSSVSQIAFSPDGRYLVSSSLDGTIKVWDTETVQLLRTIVAKREGVTAVTVSPDGRFIAKGGRNSEVKIFDIATNQEGRTLKGHIGAVTAIAFSPDGKLLASASGDGAIRIWPMDFSSDGTAITDAAGYVLSLAFSQNGQGIISGTNDIIHNPVEAYRALPIVFSLTALKDTSQISTPPEPKATQRLCTLYSFRDNSWAVIDPEGRYDASYGGDIPWLKWKLGGKVVALNQLKSVFYQPGLLPILLGNSNEPLPQIVKLTQIQPYPDVSFDAPPAGSTQLKIKLVDRGGGIGRVQVKLNNTEISEDARGPRFKPEEKDVTLNVDLLGPALIPGKPNRIQVVAWNASGYLSSSTEDAISWTPTNLSGDSPFLNNGQPDNTPQEFYAIVIGTSEYSHPSIRLKYSSRDAEAFARSLELGAKRLFPGEGRAQGKGRVHIKLLRTSDDPQTLPTKNNIALAFEEARNSRTQDVIVIYMSGHGVVLRGHNPLNQNDVYSYLTKEARSKSPEAFTVPEVIKAATITSEEIAHWISLIPAQRRVLILDTCGAGAAAADLRQKGEDTSFYQIKALDKLKDRMGFFVLMGSAANAVSWEASAFGQGLLTYALLTKMKSSEPNKDESEVDVVELFRFATEAVPQLAFGLGGIQQPEVIVPQGSTSFPIGLLNLSDKKNIPLQLKKPIVLSPNFLNRDEGTDEELELTRALSKKLDEESYMRAKGSTFESEIVYVEANRLQGAYSPSGTYVIEGDDVKVDLVLSNGSQRIRFPVNGSRNNIPALAKKMLDRIIEEVTKAQRKTEEQLKTPNSQ